MRNTLKYPITTAELIEYCNRQIKDLSYEKTGLIGDMRPLYYTELIDMLHEKLEHTVLS